MKTIIALGLAKRNHEERYFKQFALLSVITIFSPFRIRVHFAINFGYRNCHKITLPHQEIRRKVTPISESFLNTNNPLRGFRGSFVSCISPSWYATGDGTTSSESPCSKAAGRQLVVRFHLLSTYVLFCSCFVMASTCEVNGTKRESDPGVIIIIIIIIIIMFLLLLLFLLFLLSYVTGLLSW